MASAKKPTKTKFKPQGGEQRLIEALRAGKDCEFIYAGDDKEPDKDRTIRGDILGQLLRSEILEGEEDPIPLPRAVGIVGAIITGKLDMSDTDTGLVLRIKNSEFKQTLDFTRAKLALLNLEGSELVGAEMIGIKIRSELWLDNIQNKGGFNLVGAKIGGQFSANEAKFENPSSTAINAQGAEIAAHVFLSDAEIVGEADFNSAKIRGQFAANGAKFENHKGTALLLQDAEVKGLMWLADFPHPPIGGLDFTNAQLNAVAIDDNSYPLGHLDLDGTRYDTLVQSDWTAHTACEGWLRPLSLEIREARLNALEDAADKSIKEALDGKDFSALPEGVQKKILDIKKSQIVPYSDFTTPVGYWLAFSALCENMAKGKDGYLDKAELQSKARAAIDSIMAKQNAATRSPFAFRQFAKVLDANGHEREARDVRIEAGDAYTERVASTFSKWRGRLYKAWRGVLKLLLAYGVKPWRILPTLAIYWAIGFAVFGIFDDTMTPAKERYYMAGLKKGELPTPYKLGDALPEGYPEFSPPVYALDVMLPVADFAQESHWRPRNTDYGRWNWMRIVNRFYLVFGWLLSTLAIAGMSGLISDKREP